jgi:hypothetical protein
VQQLVSSVHYLSLSATLTTLQASKRLVNATAVTGVTNSKTGPLQVIFNGKIVTPQSLILKKGHHTSTHKDNYVNKKGKPLAKQQTIDETASEAADRTSSAPISKLQSKK